MSGEEMGKLTKKAIGKFWEDCFPYILTLLIVVIYISFKKYIQFPEGNELYAATLTFFGILLGFVSTSKAILMGMKSPLIDYLNERGKLKELFDYISSSVWACLLAAVINLIAFFIPKNFTCYQFVWLVFVSLGILMFLRVTNLILKILKTHYKSEGEKKAEEKKAKQDNFEPIPEINRELEKKEV